MELAIGGVKRGRARDSKRWPALSSHRSRSRSNHVFTLCRDRHGLLPAGLQSALRMEMKQKLMFGNIGLALLLGTVGLVGVLPLQAHDDTIEKKDEPVA